MIKNIDEFIAGYPKEVQLILKKIKKTIKDEVPDAEETINYGIPTFKLNGKNLVHFSAYKHHIGFYPTPSAIEKFKKEISEYKWAKGSVQFPLDKPIPYELIARIVKFRVEQELKNSESTKAKKIKAGILNDKIEKYNQALSTEEKEICNLLAKEITNNLPEAENKLWHGSPVWFLNGNPVVGYSKLKDCVRVLFWSGQSFGEEKLQKEGSFKAAEIRYTNIGQVSKKDLEKWIRKARKIQWDYKNIVKRKGVLKRLTL